MTARILLQVERLEDNEKKRLLHIVRKDRKKIKNEIGSYTLVMTGNNQPKSTRIRNNSIIEAL